MELTHLETYPQPEGNDPGSVPAALKALAQAHDESSALEACDRFLWTVGNNHAGTFFPIVLAALPQMEQILIGGGAWSRQAAMEALIDLGGPFVPEQGHETHLGVPVQETLRLFIRSMRPHILPLTHASGELRRSAEDLVELIDDLADLP
ncbi:MAG TPA: hypothetical protein VFL86_25920 [Burkholderiaceae bacterium]|nr:hypothetical protein [Burkholderiaceae bacterium]